VTANPVARWFRVWWLNRLIAVAVLFDRKEAALGLLRRVVRENPRDQIARSSIGNLTAELGRPDEAVQEFQELVALAPNNAEAWFNLGFLYDQRDDLAEAEQAFRKAVALQPSLDRAWYGLGLVLVRGNRLGEAVSAFRRTIKLQPFAPYAYYQLGMTQHHMGLTEDAAKTLAELEKFEPRFAATLRRDMSRLVPQAVPGQPEETAGQGKKEDGPIQGS